MLDIVVFPACKSCHAFHKECVLMHFKNMKKDDKLVNFYSCPVCKVTFGDRTGKMPPGKMTWRHDKYDYD